MAEKAETEPNIAHFTRFIADEEMGKEVRFFFREAGLMPIRRDRAYSILFS
jgi:hypothetical protein